MPRPGASARTLLYGTSLACVVSGAHYSVLQPLPCEKEGYLIKKGGKRDGGLGRGRWQRRFFQLRGTELSYFQSEQVLRCCSALSANRG